MASNFFNVLNEITGNTPLQNCQISVLERIYIELTQTPQKHLLSRALLVVNIIELLSQFNSGKLHKKGNQKRFDRFLQAYANTSSDTNYLLYTFRNALVHNGGSYASDQKGNVYRFQLKQEGKLIQETSRVVYTVNVNLFQKLLDQILISLEERLKIDKSLQQRFILVHKRIGITVN